MQTAVAVPRPKDPLQPSDPEQFLHDVLIVGGGPAGLSAALLLGRCGRAALVIDSGHPRNAASPTLHGYLTRDGTPPADFLEIARHELTRYSTIRQETARAYDLTRHSAGFTVILSSGQRRQGRKLLLATGLRDRIPEIEGIDHFYGHSVHHCPYCDGWEHRGKPVGVIGGNALAAELAKELLVWSPDVTLFTDSRDTPPELDRETLSRLGVRIVDGAVLRLEGEGKKLAAVVTEAGPVACNALFFFPEEDQRSTLAIRAGCPAPNGDGVIECPGPSGCAAPGVYLAGNLTRGPQMIAIATAEGLKAAAAINAELQNEDQSAKLRHVSAPS